LVIDHKNQSDDTVDRIKAWLAEIKPLLLG
jgi:hypothetical protein